MLPRKGFVLYIVNNDQILIIYDYNRSGFKGILWKASRIGERMSQYIGEFIFNVYYYYAYCC